MKNNKQIDLNIFNLIKLFTLGHGNTLVSLVGIKDVERDMKKYSYASRLFNSKA